MSDPIPNSSKAASAAAGQYVVIARRYRPQTFQDLIGQEHVATALSNAITTDRVGHAYLFTGARGVGKTSAARIFAKALNCEKGPAAVPCNQCDLCQMIATGDDMDVLEIDGASNRGIDEIRQLRQNVNIRPSRARLKIYIIDEVHMLTREAFNALLKTLEEPPEHVKFIFCTTEPSKIPVTILSRCQRFDFAGILRERIAQRLQKIIDAEGVQADAEALQVLARRAAGSMRDAESLLEQLLAFSPGQITIAGVHGMLGSAGEERLAALAGHLLERNAAAAWGELDAAVHEGIDPGQLLEQLFGYFRDCLAAAVGCGAETFLYASSSRLEEVTQVGDRLGLHTMLAAMQILDQTLSRLRYSTQGRILAELALVQICHLEELDALPGLIAQLEASPASGPPDGPKRSSPPRPAPNPATGPVTRPASRPVTRPAAKKKIDPPTPEPEAESSSPPAGHASATLTSETVTELWSRVLSKLTGMAAEHASRYDHIAIPAPNQLVVQLKAGYTLAKSVCERPDQLAKFEEALFELTGQRIRVRFGLAEAQGGEGQAESAARAVSPQQRIAEIAQHPMIQKAGELFGAHPTHVGQPPGNQ